MSYHWQPARSTVSLHIGSMVHNLTVQSGDRAVPEWAAKFLGDCGWTVCDEQPDYNEPLFHKAEELAGGLLYHWYEAIAYEQYKFMTLAGGND